MDKHKAINEVLGYQGPLDYTVEYHVLGVPVCFRSNMKLVIDRVSSALDHWDQLPEELCQSSRNLTVDIVTQNSGGNSISAQFDFYHRYHGDTYLASDSQNMLCACRSEGKSLAFVTPELLANEPAFCWFVVEALALSLVTWLYRIPFHASAVTKNDKGIAFMGKSGVGKSSLAYACLRKGFNLLSEDAIYVGMESDFRIWGNATKVHLLPESIGLFPELTGHNPKVLPNGKTKITVPLSEIGNSTPALQVPSVTVCLIEPDHNNQRSSLEPVTPDQVIEVVMSSLEPGFSLSSKQIPAALERLLCNQAYRLSVGYDLNATTDLLLNLV